tara:strand:- start:1544 stop:2554 length:1011 start_codon:yes stop_codon:yes gene_type:complete
MRACDYIATALSKRGVKYVYGVMGGGAAGLNDGFIKNSNIQYIGFHHEQGASHAAIGESKVTKKIAVVNPTTGCGGTNCVTSVLDAWQDSIPVVFISGNVRLSHTSSHINRINNTSIRKFGIQEHDIVSTVKSITKYSKFVETAEDVPYELERAIHEATSGRMGPVWLDIPSDVQHGDIPETHKTFTPGIDNVLNKGLDYVEQSINNYDRPLVLAGYGVVLSDSKNDFKKFIEQNNVPFVTSYLGIDILGYEHPLNLGTIGIKGSRAGNFAIQNCDCLIVMGCSLNSSHLGYDENLFSPKSHKIIIDIDSDEHAKNKVKIDKLIKADLREFFNHES